MQQRTACKKCPLLRTIRIQKTLRFLPLAFIREAIESYYKNCVLLPVSTKPTVVKTICKFSGGVFECHSNLS